ncbi:ribose 5-phosphate isomerase B [Krasilnikovia sp. M28-CT-15]|uniref:ribose 5-phosphate isomerase B n=1 Tax=Krasilnikovia sp. M28-CT-15 TaxID=3373540 RepID=UPI003875B0A7
MKVAIGADHAGVRLKRMLIRSLTRAGHDVTDFGVFDEEMVDYPAVCAAVGRAVAEGRFERGIVLGGSGQGEQIAANKVPGVRAALCNDLYLARLSREHNDANVLAMGAFVVGADLAAEIVTLWLATAFEGGRHARRVGQLESPPAWPVPSSAMSAGRPDPVFAGTIRDMTSDDLPIVLDIVAANDAELRPVAEEEIGAGFPAVGRPPFGRYIVAEIGGEIVGVVGWIPDHFDVPHVNWLVWGYVRPGLQRNGIGAALFDAAEARLVEQGIRKVYLDVGNAVTHESAIAFHRKRGYTREGVLTDFWQDGEDMLIFGKHMR